MNNKLATNNDAEPDAIEHEQNWRVNVDHPIFVRVKYLVTTESKIAILFA
jgi:hypothetical protein